MAMATKSVCDVIKQFDRYPKDVIIQAFLGGVAFFHTAEVLEECKRIHEDNQFKALMAQGDELSRQLEVLLAKEPRGDCDRSIEWLKSIIRINKEQDKIQKKINKLLHLDY